MAEKPENWTRAHKLQLTAITVALLALVIAVANLVLTPNQKAALPAQGLDALTGLAYLLPFLGAALSLLALSQSRRADAFALRAQAARDAANERAAGAGSVAQAAEVAAGRAKAAAEAAEAAAKASGEGIETALRRLETVPAVLWDARQIDWIVQGRTAQVRIDEATVERDSVVLQMGLLHFGGLELSASGLSLNGVMLGDRLVGPVQAEADRSLPLPGWRPYRDNWAFFRFSFPTTVNDGLVLAGKRLVRLSWQSGSYKIRDTEGKEREASIPSGFTRAEVTRQA